MPDLLDAAQRLQLLRRAHIGGVPMDDLDGLGKLARSDHLPDFAIAAAPQSLDELVARYGFSAFGGQERHDAPDDLGEARFAGVSLLRTRCKFSASFDGTA